MKYFEKYIETKAEQKKKKKLQKVRSLLEFVSLLVDGVILKLLESIG
jgi:hypothetical protein